MQNEQKMFLVHGFGEAGYSNLYAFVPFPGFKKVADLDIDETTEGRFQSPTSDKKPERVTRIR